jgi:hypothetical protein
MVKINRAVVCLMTNKKHVLAIGLAVAALAAVFPFFAGGVLLLQPSLAPLVAQAGLTQGSGPAWFGPVFGFSAVGLSTASFLISWKQKSFAVAGLLAAAGVMFMMPALMATGYFAVIVIPGPIFGVFIGLGIFGLGLAKGLRTARSNMVSSDDFTHASLRSD